MLRIIGRSRLWLSVGIGLFGMALLAWPRASAAGISRGLSVCGGIILPSLFPFLVLGGFAVYSGAAAAVGRRLSGVTRVLFGLPGAAAAAVLIALVGGYPAGANAVAALHKNGDVSRDEARHLLRFCVCGGPGYIVGAVGANLTGDTRFGWILFAANTLAALLIGILYAPSRRRVPSTPVAGTPLPPAAALVKAVTAACESALYMCGFILLFSALLSLADASGLTALLGKAAVLLPCLLEVSSGCIAAVDNAAAPLLLGFTLGFGGLSVHCQVSAAVRDGNLLSGSFFMGRLVHGALGALLTYGLCRLIPRSSPVFGIGDAALTRPLFDSLPLSAALFLLCGIWMLTVPPRKLDATS